MGDGRAKAPHPVSETRFLSTETWPVHPHYGPNSKSLIRCYNHGLYKRHQILQILGSHMKSQQPLKPLTKYLILAPLKSPLSPRPPSSPRSCSWKNTPLSAKQPNATNATLSSHSPPRAKGVPQWIEYFIHTLSGEQFFPERNWVVKILNQMRDLFMAISNHK